MSNRRDDMLDAITEAEAVLRSADSVATDLVRVLVGRLRCVKTYQGQNALSKLKKELAAWNIKTRRWKP